MAVPIGGLLRLIAIGMVIAAAGCSPVGRPAASPPTAGLPAAARAATTPLAAPGPAPADSAVERTTGFEATSDTSDTATAADNANIAATSSAAAAKRPPIPISIAPVTGTPGAMRYAMEDDLKKYAATRNFTVVPAEDPTVVYRLKGRVTAVGDTSGGLLVYVWDVMNASGTKVHHVAGQQVAGSTQADPWAGVTGANIDAAARETIDGLADWVRGQTP